MAISPSFIPEKEQENEWLSCSSCCTCCLQWSWTTAMLLFWSTTFPLAVKANTSKWKLRRRKTMWPIVPRKQNKSFVGKEYKLLTGFLKHKYWEADCARQNVACGCDDARHATISIISLYSHLIYSNNRSSAYSTCHDSLEIHNAAQDKSQCWTLSFASISTFEKSQVLKFFSLMKFGPILVIIVFLLLFFFLAVVCYSCDGNTLRFPLRAPLC